MFGLCTILNYYLAYSLLKQVIRTYIGFYTPLYNDEWSCIFVLGISNLPISEIFPLYFGTVLTVWYLGFSFYQNNLKTVCLNHIDTYDALTSAINNRKHNEQVFCLVYFTGVMNRDLTLGLNIATNEFNNFLVTGIASSIVANRISYHFDIRGPSITIDTACSSALVSIHLGSQAIKSGECRIV